MKQSLNSGLWMLALLLCLLPAAAGTYTLSDGSALTGEPVAFDDKGIVLKDDTGKYLPRIVWGKFTQEALRELAKNPKISPFVESYIEITPEQRAQQSAIVVKEVPRPARPTQKAHFSSVFGTTLGFVILTLLYLANLYAAFEVSIFRARPVALVCGVAAIAPVIGPIIFLCLPTLLPPKQDKSRADDPGAVIGPNAPEIEAVVVEDIETASAPAGSESAGAPGGSVPQVPANQVALPAAQVFTRGHYTFNRRFFESRVAGFIGVLPKDDTKDLLLVVKSARGDIVASRIVRATQTDLHLLVRKDGASMEEPVPYIEIRELQIKHKNAP